MLRMKSKYLLLRVVWLCMFFVAVSTGSVLAQVQDVSTPNGTYRVTGQYNSFNVVKDGVATGVSATIGTMSFSGNGICSFDLTSTGYGVFIPVPGLNTANSDITSGGGGLSKGDCTYTVADTGAVEVTIDGTGEKRNLWVSRDGNLIITGNTTASSPEFSTNQLMAFKEPSGLSSASLFDSYRVLQQDETFISGDGGAKLFDFYASSGTVTFDGSGGCKGSFSGADYVLNPGSGTGVTAYTDPASSRDCTYGVDPTGTAWITFTGGSQHTFYVGADAKTVHFGTVGPDPDNTNNMRTQQMVGVKLGKSLTKASFQGKYAVVGQDNSFWGTGYPSIDFSGVAGTITTDGNGNCSFDMPGKNFTIKTDIPGVNQSEFGGMGVTCTYTISSTGAIKLTHPHGFLNLQLSDDGKMLIGGGASKVVESATSVGYVSDQWLAVQTDPYAAYLDPLNSPTVPANDPDGKFAVSWTASATPGVTYILQESTDPGFPEDITTRVAYKGVNTTANVSVKTKPQTYYYRVKATKIGFADSDWAVAENPCNAGLPALPTKIAVPANDVDGSFAISWTPSTTVNVNYVLEEATDKGFTTSLRQVYSGSESQIAVLGNAGGGIYYYRLKVQKEGFQDSAWKIASAPCKVSATASESITVPANSAVGNSVFLEWAPSVTAGVTYMVQESTTADFSSVLRKIPVKAGITSLLLTGQKTGVYYYRVQALKTGFQASLWTEGANPYTVSRASFATTDFSGKTIYDAEGPVLSAPQASNYMRLQFNSNGSFQVSDWATNGSPIVGAATGNTWQVVNGVLQVTTAKGASTVTLLSDDQVNRCWLVQKQSGITRWYYDQATAQTQAQEFASSSATPSLTATTAMFADKTTTNPTTWNGEPALNTKIWNANGTWSQSTVQLSAPATIVGSSSGTWSVANGQLIFTTTSANYATTMNTPITVNVVAYSTAAITLVQDGQTEPVVFTYYVDFKASLLAGHTATFNFTKGPTALTFSATGNTVTTKGGSGTWAVNSDGTLTVTFPSDALTFRIFSGSGNNFTVIYTHDATPGQIEGPTAVTII